MSSLCPVLPQQLEKLIEKNYYLHRSARDGFRSYLQSYASHSLKAVFNVEQLDLQRVAKAFGFATPPGVSLSILVYCTHGDLVYYSRTNILDLVYY